MDQVVWKRVDPEIIGGYDKLEVCLELGKIRNSETKKVYNGYKMPSGYIRVHIGNNSYLLHRIVASVGLQNPKNLPLVNHIDGKRDNNIISNLEWVTQAENNSSEKRALPSLDKSWIYLEYRPDGSIVEHTGDSITKNDKTNISRSIRTNKTYMGSMWLIVNRTVKDYLEKFSLGLSPSDFTLSHPVYKDVLVSSSGLVWIKNSNRPVISMSLAGGKYSRQIVINKKIKTFLVSRLVFEAFAEKVVPEKLEVDHIDSNPLNNQIKNLRLVNHVENMNNKNTIAKYSHKVSMFSIDGDFEKSYNSIRDLFRDFDMNEKSTYPKFHIFRNKIIIKDGESIEEVISNLVFRYQESTNVEELCSGVKIAVSRGLLNTGKPSQHGWIYYTGKGNYTKFINNGSSKI